MLELGGGPEAAESGVGVVGWNEMSEAAVQTTREDDVPGLEDDRLLFARWRLARSSE